MTEGLAAARPEGIEALIEALERFGGVRFPEPRRTGWLENDPAALDAAWRAALAEGPISADLRAWRVPCLIFIGEGDADFLDQARRAAGEIPNAEFLSLGDSTTTARTSTRRIACSMPSSARCEEPADSSAASAHATGRR